jgi:hypothetical protein
MKSIKYFAYILASILIIGCEQEVIELTPPEVVVPPPICEGAAAGSATFTKFVAIGNSFVAGFQAGALYNEGQANSLAKIVAKQLECVGGTTTFNQPDINSQNGYNVQLSIPGVITLGRLVLFDPDGAGSRTAAPSPAGFPGSSVTCPSALTTPPLPAPYNTADLPTAFSGSRAALNNFAVPLIYLGQSLIPDTGNPASPYYNPLWARFASQPGVKSILQDALIAGGSFYLFWLGIDDVLLYAAGGADNAGSIQMTSEANFNAQYNGAITTMLTGTTFKGVVGNIPNFTTLPYFYTVAWNQIALDAATAATLTTNLANNYNAFLTGMVGAGVINDAEKAKRMLTYAAGKNGVLLSDEDLTDLSPYMVGPYAGLAPYARARQATSTDLIPLSAGSVLGTCFGGSPNAVFGVSYPVGDKYALTPTETTAILTRTAAFNTVITTAVAGSANRLALADVNKAYGDFVAAKAFVANNVTITPSFAPPTGAFSEDGLHPNSRGYAFTANIFIDAINVKFGATIPKASLATTSGTDLPITPL